MIAGKIALLMTSLKESVRSFIPVIILVVFTCIGGAIFVAIEAPNERFELEELRDERAKLLEHTAFQLNTIRHMTPIQAYNHTVATLVNYRKELGVKEVNLNETKWTIWGAIYYSMTIYTTIGYGNITPHTSTGKILTILYAFIGIPLALISLIALGSLFAKACMMLWKLIIQTFGCFSKKLEKKMTKLGPSYSSSENQSEEDDSEELLQFPVTFLIFLTICWIFLCAYIFLLWEESWSYGTSLYFVLISFTTIGFGDVLVSKSKYIIPVGCLLLIGLALVSTVLTIIQKQIEAVAKGMRTSIDNEYRIALEQAEEEIDEEDELKENGADLEVGKKGGKGKGGKEKKPKSLEDVIKRMPLKSRLLYHIMPAGNRKQLNKHAKKRAQIGMKWVQTDPFLMEGASGGGFENINY